MDLILRPATRIFLDTEFYEDGTTIDLISLALVTETGDEFYAANREARLDRVSPWVREHVLPQLPPYRRPLDSTNQWWSRKQIAEGIITFVQTARDRNGDRPVEFWAYYADYDWVLLCQLYGTMMQLPPSFPKFCMDLKQLSVHRGSPDHPPQTEGVHNALADARWNRDLFRFLHAHDPAEARRARLGLED